VEFGHFRSQPYGKRGYLVQFEPKMSITGAKADRWVPVRPGAEGLVAQAMIKLIAEEKFGPAERIARAEQLAGEVNIAEAAAACEMSVEEFIALTRSFAAAEHPVAIPGDALTGRNNGLEAAVAVQALNVVAGTVGQPGGLSVMPAVDNFAAPVPSTFAQVQRLIERMTNGQIEILLIHGANPVYDLPKDAGFVDALKQVETIVSFNPMMDETSLQADYILPDRVYLEGWGYEVVRPGFQSLPVISSQQPVVAPLYDVRATGDALLTLARGIPAAASALPWTDEVAFIKDMITALPKGASGGDDADTRWARFLQHGGWWPESRASEPPEPAASSPIEVTPTTFRGEEAEYPYFLHLYLPALLSDGSGANIPWLQGSPEPMTTISWQTWVEINPKTADKLDVENGDIVKIESPHGEIEVPVYIFPAIRPDTIAIPFGQGHSDYGRYAQDRGSHPMKLVGAELDDSGSRQAWANVRVKIRKTGEDQALAVLETTVDQAKDAHIPF
jgi:anaerobic selenocysteine-containing dehydrogenase